MAQVIGKWILDETITPPKMDSTATFIFEGIIVGDATVTRNLQVDGLIDAGMIAASELRLNQTNNRPALDMTMSGNAPAAMNLLNTGTGSTLKIDHRSQYSIGLLIDDKSSWSTGLSIQMADPTQTTGLNIFTPTNGIEVIEAVNSGINIYGNGTTAYGVYSSGTTVNDFHGDGTSDLNSLWLRELDVHGEITTSKLTVFSDIAYDQNAFSVRMGDDSALIRFKTDPSYFDRPIIESSSRLTLKAGVDSGGAKIDLIDSVGDSTIYMNARDYELSGIMGGKTTLKVNNGDSSVFGNSYVQGDQSVGGSLTVENDLLLWGYSYVGKNGRVVGNSTVDGTFYANNDSSVQYNSYVGGESYIGSDLRVVGSSYVLGNTIIGGNAGIIGTLLVDEIIPDASTSVTINSDATVADNLYVGGDASVAGIVVTTGIDPNPFDHTPGDTAFTIRKYHELVTTTGYTINSTFWMGTLDVRFVVVGKICHFWIIPNYFSGAVLKYGKYPVLLQNITAGALVEVISADVVIDLSASKFEKIWQASPTFPTPTPASVPQCVFEFLGAKWTDNEYTPSTSTIDLYATGPINDTNASYKSIVIGARSSTYVSYPYPSITMHWNASLLDDPSDGQFLMFYPPMFSWFTE